MSRSISKLEQFVDTDTKPSEPAVKVGSITGTVAGVLALVAYLAPNFLTDKQTTIILIVAAFVLPIVTALFTRGKVWSPASVEELIEEAVTEAKEVVLKDQTQRQKMESRYLRTDDGDLAPDQPEV